MKLAKAKDNARGVELYSLYLWLRLLAKYQRPVSRIRDTHFDIQSIADILHIICIQTDNKVVMSHLSLLRFLQ